MIVARKAATESRRRGTNPETKLRNAIFEFLGDKSRCPEVSWIAVNAGGFDYDRKVRYGLGPGTGDLVGAFVAGAFGWNGPSAAFEVEVKTATGRQSSDQQDRQAHLDRDGGLYRVLRSVEDAEQWIAELRGGAK